MEHRFLETSASDWGLSLRAACWIFWLPLVATAALCAVPPVYGALGSEGQWLVRRALDVVMGEDGPVEWAQVACFASGSVAAGLTAKRLLANGLKGQAGLFAFVALGLFLVVGEEISWGQRILGLITPAWLTDINDQDELNAHNIAGVRKFLSYPRMILATGGVLGGLALRRRGRRLSPLFLVPAFGVMLGYDVLRETLWREPGVFLRMVGYGEWPELSFAFSAGTFLVLGYRRMAHADKPPLAFEPAAKPERIDPAA